MFYFLDFVYTVHDFELSSLDQIPLLANSQKTNMIFGKNYILLTKFFKIIIFEKVQVGKDQEKAQSEKDSHSKNRGGKKPN